jgi:hypothetical protein
MANSFKARSLRDLNEQKRIPIPADVTDEVLYRNDHTCCICNIPRKHVQIHHLDEDPANNSATNLAVLCQILAAADEPRRRELLEVLYQLHMWRGTTQLDRQIIEGFGHLAVISGLVCHNLRLISPKKCGNSVGISWVPIKCE